MNFILIYWCFNIYANYLWWFSFKNYWFLSKKLFSQAKHKYFCDFFFWKIVLNVYLVFWTKMGSKLSVLRKIVPLAYLKFTPNWLLNVLKNWIWGWNVTKISLEFLEIFLWSQIFFLVLLWFLVKVQICPESVDRSDSVDWIFRGEPRPLRPERFKTQFFFSLQTHS